MSDLQYDVICVGAGFSGLSAAHTLLKSRPGLKVCVLEAKDRVGGRTELQEMKCADADGHDDLKKWEFGGMWVGRTQLDVMELLKELDIKTYDQYITGTKFIKLNADTKARKYSSDLPSVGVLSTIDLGQAMSRLEWLVKAVGAENPWKHADAELLDSITVAGLLKKVTFTDKVKEMIVAATRTVFGADPSQINALYFLTYCAAGGSFQQIVGATPGTAQEYKIVGGSQNVCSLLVDNYIGAENVKLSTPVTKIEQNEDTVSIYSCQHKYQCKYAILAMPPQQLLKIDFIPALPNSKLRLIKMMSTGHLIKVIVTYRKAYWRERGYSGEIVTTDPKETAQGAISIVYDATSEQGHPALVVFIGGDQATAWGDKPPEERRQAVLDSLSEIMEIQELKHPIDYREKDWAKEKYNGGCPTDVVNTGVMKYYNELKAPLGRVEFAGTESSSVWSGYLSGAVNAGKRAANKVIEKLNK